MLKLKKVTLIKTDKDFESKKDLDNFRKELSLISGAALEDIYFNFDDTTELKQVK